VSAPSPPLYRRAGDLPQHTVEAARRDRVIQCMHCPTGSMRHEARWSSGRLGPRPYRLVVSAPGHLAPARRCTDEPGMPHALLNRRRLAAQPTNVRFRGANWTSPEGRVLVSPWELARSEYYCLASLKISRSHTRL
jgi:hypothetical protein